MIKQIIAILVFQYSVCYSATVFNSGYLINTKCNMTTSTGERYYVVDENNAAKYVECANLNWGIEQSCAEGTYFDVKMISCMVPENSSMKIDGVIVYQNRMKRELTNETINNSTSVMANQTVDNSTVSNCNATDRNSTNGNDKRMLVDISVLDMIPLENSTHIDNSTNQMSNMTSMSNQTVNDNSTQKLNAWKRDLISSNSSDNSNSTNNNNASSVNNTLCTTNEIDYPVDNGNMTTEFKTNCSNVSTDTPDNATMQSSLNFPVSDQSSDNQDQILVDTRDLIDQINNLTNLINSTLYGGNNSKNATDSSSNTTNSTSTVVVKKRSLYTILTGAKSDSCSCVNGVCDDYSDSFGCICFTNFTGDLCQTPVDESTKTYFKILNGSLTIYDIINHTNVSNYAVLWNGVVENLWSEISPEHAYITKHNISLNGGLNDIGESILKYNVYARQSEISFSSKIVVLENVLAKLVENPGEKLKQSAVSFLDSLIKFTQIKQSNTDNRMMKWPRVELVHKFSQDDMKTKIINQLDTATIQSSKLLTSFKMSNVIDFVNSDDTKNTIQSIKNSSVESWNMVDDYGFMYFTYKLANTTGEYYDFTPEQKLSYYDYILSTLNHHEKRSIIDTLWEKIKKAKIISKETWNKFVEWIKKQKKNEHFN